MRFHFRRHSQLSFAFRGRASQWSKFHVQKIRLDTYEHFKVRRQSIKGSQDIWLRLSLNGSENVAHTTAPSTSYSYRSFQSTWIVHATLINCFRLCVIWTNHKGSKPKSNCSHTYGYSNFSWQAIRILFRCPSNCISWPCCIFEGSWSLDSRPAVVTYQNKFCHSCVVTGSCLRSLFTVGFNSCHLSSNWTVGLFELNSREDILFSPILLRAPAGWATSQAPIDRWTDRQTPFVTKQDMTPGVSPGPCQYFFFQWSRTTGWSFVFRRSSFPFVYGGVGKTGGEGWGRLSSVGGLTDRSSDK